MGLPTLCLLSASPYAAFILELVKTLQLAQGTLRPLHAAAIAAATGAAIAARAAAAADLIEKLGSLWQSRRAEGKRKGEWAGGGHFDGSRLGQAHRQAVGSLAVNGRSSPRHPHRSSRRVDRTSASCLRQARE